MPLQTAPFPIILILIFVVVPIIILLGIIVGVFYYFWRFKNRPKFLMAGAAVLLLYGLGMTYVTIAASSYNSYFVEVKTCDQHKITGLDENGKSKTLYFPRWFGSGRPFGLEGVAIKTVNQDGNWNSSRPIEICDQILGAGAGFDTDGLKRIELVKLLNNPLSFSLPEGMEAQTTFNTISSGWFAETRPDFQAGERGTNCSDLAQIYNNKTQIDYAFLADIEKIQQRGDNPYNFAFRIYVLPNLTGYKNLDDLNYDWESCYSPEHVNSFPILVSPSWIAFADGCEGVFDGCITAQDAIRDSLNLAE